METWRRVLRVGILPELPIRHLEALRAGLIADDPHLTQGATVCPSPLQCVLDWPVEGACLIGYGGWKAGDYKLVGEAEEHFARVCFAANQRLGEPAAVRFALNAYDDWPRNEMIQNILPEIEWALAERLQPKGE